MNWVSKIKHAVNDKISAAGIPPKTDWPQLYGGWPATDENGRDRTIAEIADRQWLYENSVQDSAAEVKFVRERFHALRGYWPTLLREDFCGTATVCAEWVKTGPESRALGFDLDAETLEWGAGNNLQLLSEEAQQRIMLVKADCSELETSDIDVLMALNFSYWLFMDRQKLGNYFKACCQSLSKDGILVLDAFGGSEAHELLTEDRECEGFIYQWEQASLNPVTMEMQCYLHFNFPDGSAMPKAFSYYWRVWSLPELSELLTEAGFAKPKIYWHEPQDDGAVKVGREARDFNDPDPGWICYLVCEAE